MAENRINYTTQFLVSTLFKFCCMIGNKKDMKGEDKKKWVLLRLKEEFDLNEESNKQLISIISEFIDWIVIVDKGELKINPTIKQVKYLCC